jgi:site-specific recombinase XerD
MTAQTTAGVAAVELLEDLAESWVIYLESERKAPATIALYAGSAAAFIAWHQRHAAPGMPVAASSLDRRTASAFLADLMRGGAAPATARARYSALRQFSAWLAEEGATDTDLLLGLRPPKLDKPRVDSVSGDELAALIRACRIPAGADTWTEFACLRDEAVIRLLVDTGMRAGELVALTTGDVDLRRRLVTITRSKGGKHRIAAFGPEAARAVDRYLRRARRGHKLAGTPALWLGDGNRSWAYPALRTALSKRAAAAQIKGFHPHRLRHSAASAWLREGGSEQGAMAQFGWSSRQMLDRYTADTAQERAIAEARRLFGARQDQGR